MKQSIVTLFISLTFLMTGHAQDTKTILQKPDQNLSSQNRVTESEMIIHGKRRSRTITSKSYTVGTEKSFTCYLSPARDAGTKMLKLNNQLWIYAPSTDRIIQISGHLIQQSVMGSDLSYEDMMDDRKLTEVYDATIVGRDTLQGRDVYIIKLTAKVDDIAYHSQKLWVDSERYVPLKEELYAKSGQLLKRVTLSDIQKVDGRWFPMKMNYKDVLKQGDGTDFKITDIKFDQNIPACQFTKAALKQ